MWIVVNIGCLECGVSSAIVGVFTEEAKAKEVAETCDTLFDWREGGQNLFEVFLLPAPDMMNPEYAAAIQENCKKSSEHSERGTHE